MIGSPPMVAEVEQQLRAIDGRRGCLSRKNRRWENFEAQFPSESHLLEGLGRIPYRLLRGDAQPVLSFAGRGQPLGGTCQTVAGVAKVDYNQEWIDALATVIRSIELAAIGMGVILSAAAVTIIGNTIRLTLFAGGTKLKFSA